MGQKDKTLNHKTENPRITFLSFGSLSQGLLLSEVHFSFHDLPKASLIRNQGNNGLSLRYRTS